MELETLKRRLKLYLEAEEKILNAQSYSLENRSLTRADLSKVQAKIAELQEEISLIENKNGRVKRTVFI